MSVAEILFWALLVLLALLLLQLALVLFGDSDLALKRALWFGKKPDSLSGRVVWITGASSGIGESLAYELARAGCRLVLSARRQSELTRVKQTCMVIGKLGTDDILTVSLDLKNVDSHKAAVKKVIEYFKQIDILVNNAGRGYRGNADRTSIAVDREILEVNLLGTLSLTKAVLPHMIHRKSGHLVVTSSVAGKLGVPYSSAYCATKFALQGWFEAARIELIGYNIAVTMVCPGPVVTENKKNNTLGEELDQPLGETMKSKEKKMMTSRFARLMVVAMANRLGEVWISIQPILLVTYITQYFPDFTRSVMTFIGSRPSLLKKIREGGG